MSTRGRELCTVVGKEIIADRSEAREAAKSLRAVTVSGTASAYRCPFGDHYHIASARSARKGRKGSRQ